ncbi:hypothetical protein [Actinomadura harenae]|uniref:Uncharacterized protein n=1 Tax=Actinomadura harenae TaxID=2483351 RepID=A0A3M2M2L7_9ACTN|nr:hypothetical protein [Actinomadura harenae]RMI43839.1 hypothetical protein EBO15_15375 [Actinomadura harenae]
MSMRNARRRTPLERFPKGLASLGVLLLVAQIGLGIWAVLPGGASEQDGPRSSGTEQVDVNIVVTGERRTADVSFQVTDSADGTTLTAAALPVRRTLRMRQDGRLSVKALNRPENGPGLITCTVLIGERVISQRTSQYDAAHCADVRPTDPTVEGAKVPEQAGGTRPGEVRLTRTVPVKRYPGRGSPRAGQVKDRDARLSYMSFGGSWGNSRVVDPTVQGFTRKQSFETEVKWEASIASGLVSDDLMANATGRDRLRALAENMQDYRQRVGFGSVTAHGRDVASQPLNVNGNLGWVVVREIRFSKQGLRAKTDLAAVVVLDAGRPRPSFLYVDVPDTHKRLWPDVNTLIDSIRVP